MPERRPAANGVLDPRLGVSNKRASCETCGQTLLECTGHFGYLKLELPVFHIGYFRNTVQILQCVCKACSRVMLAPEERRAFLRRFRNSALERVVREGVFKRLLDRCKRVRRCPHCGSDNGVVKKTPGSLKIVHDLYAKNVDLLAALHVELAPALGNEALAAVVQGPATGGGGGGGGKAPPNKLMDDLNPIRVAALFAAIPDAVRRGGWCSCWGVGPLWRD